MARRLVRRQSIRDRDKTASVVMISDEPYRSYNRPMLTKSIMAELDEDQIAFRMKDGIRNRESFRFWVKK